MQLRMRFCTGQKANAKVNKQQADSKRFEKSVNDIVRRSSRNKSKMWDLETRIKNADSNLYSSQREAKDLTASIGMFE